MLAAEQSEQRSYTINDTAVDVLIESYARATTPDHRRRGACGDTAERRSETHGISRVGGRSAHDLCDAGAFSRCRCPGDGMARRCAAPNAP